MDDNSLRRSFFLCDGIIGDEIDRDIGNDIGSEIGSTILAGVEEAAADVGDPDDCGEDDEIGANANDAAVDSGVDATTDGIDEGVEIVLFT